MNFKNELEEAQKGIIILLKYIRLLYVTDYVTLVKLSLP